MELLCELTGWVDKARMTVSGTEATMHAMRIARAYTGREKIVKFEGQYHGVHDYALISVGPDDMSELGDADAPGRPGLGPGDPRRRRRHDHPGALQQHRLPAPAVRAAGRRDRRDHRRAGPRQCPGDPAQARLPPGDASPDRGVRDPADLRRGQDRVPVRQGRRRRVLRDHPGPRHLRQGDGQRLPGCRVRRTRGGHERAARQGQPRRHVRREPGRRRGRGQDADDPQGDRRPRDDPRDRPARPGRAARGPQPDGAAVPLHRSPVDVRDHVPRGGGPRVPRLGDHGPRAVRRDRDRDARPRRDARAGLARALVPVRGPRRRATTSTGS